MAVDPNVITALDGLAQGRFRLEAERQRIDDEYKADEARLKAAYAHRMAPVQAKINELDSTIWRIVRTYRAGLIKPGKQSFALASATFQFRAAKAKVVPTNPDGIMDVARKLGIVGKIADPPSHKWIFNKKRFLAWLDSHAHLARHFRRYIDTTDATESLSVKPNTGHPVFHDTDRLTPIAFTVQKS